MECYTCGREAGQRCPRCNNPFCGEHGQELCARCLNPASAVPSGGVFRASLLLLLAGSVLALWLLVRPPALPGSPSEAGLPPVPSPEPSPQPFPTLTPSPAASPTPEPASTPQPSTPAPEGPIEYTVVEGDTIYSIAEKFGVTVEDLLAINGLTEDDFIHPGDVLLIPQY